MIAVVARRQGGWCKCRPVHLIVGFGRMAMIRMTVTIVRMMAAVVVVVAVIIVAMFMELEFELYLTGTVMIHIMYGPFMMGQINIGIEYDKAVRQTGGMMTQVVSGIKMSFQTFVILIELIGDL